MTFPIHVGLRNRIVYRLYSVAIPLSLRPDSLSLSIILYVERDWNLLIRSYRLFRPLKGMYIFLSFSFTLSPSQQPTTYLLPSCHLFFIFSKQSLYYLSLRKSAHKILLGILESFWLHHV